MEKVFLEQPRRGNTREAQLTPHKRSAVWGGPQNSARVCSAVWGDHGSAAQCSARVRSTVWSIRTSLALLLAVAMLPVTAQTVSHVTAEQVGKTIHVSYDLDRAADITLFLSTDGGSTYTQLYRVSGDVGKTVGPGHKTVVWDVQAEMGELRSDNVVFKVKVDANAEVAWRKKLRNEASEAKREKKDNARQEQKAWPYSTFFTLNGSYSPLPQWAWGFKVGGVKRVGWFVNVMTNFNFNGWGNPFCEGGMYYLNGGSNTIRFSAQAGFVYRPCKPVSLLLGVGYGYRTLTYQADYSWLSYPGRTYNGVDVSLGLLFDIKGFALSAEAVTTNFQTIETRIGVGFCLPSKKSKNQTKNL